MYISELAIMRILLWSADWQQICNFFLNQLIGDIASPLLVCTSLCLPYSETPSLVSWLATRQLTDWQFIKSADGLCQTIASDWRAHPSACLIVRNLVSWLATLVPISLLTWWEYSSDKLTDCQLMGNIAKPLLVCTSFCLPHSENPSLVSWLATVMPKSLPIWWEPYLISWLTADVPISLRGENPPVVNWWQLQLTIC